MVPEDLVVGDNTTELAKNLTLANLAVSEPCCRLSFQTGNGALSDHRELVKNLNGIGKDLET